MNNNVLVVGTVAIDTIETPHGKAERILGGSAPFIALAARYAGARPSIISIIGNDMPQTALTMLKKNNIDVSGIEKIQDEKSFFWSGRYHQNMNARDTLITELNVLEKFDPVVPQEMKNIEYVMLGNLHPLVQMKVINQMTNPKFVVLDTMNFWMDNAWDDLQKVIAKVHAIVINDEEASQLTGASSLVEAAKMIQKKGPKFCGNKKRRTWSTSFPWKENFFRTCNASITSHRSNRRWRHFCRRLYRYNCKKHKEKSKVFYSQKCNSIRKCNGLFYSSRVWNAITRRTQ